MGAKAFSDGPQLAFFSAYTAGVAPGPDNYGREGVPGGHNGLSGADLNALQADTAIIGADCENVPFNHKPFFAKNTLRGQGTAWAD